MSQQLSPQSSLPHTRRYDHRFTVLGFIPTLIWGTAVGLAGSLAPVVGPLTAAGSVYLLAGSVLILLASIRGNVVRKISALDRRAFLFCFLFFWLNVTTFWLSMGLASSKTQIPELGLINYLWPTTTLLFALPILRLDTHWWFIPGVLLATLGVMLPLASTHDVNIQSFTENISAHWLPYFLALTAAVTWGVYSNLTRKWHDRLNSTAPALYLLLSGVTLFSCGMIWEKASVWNQQAILELIFVGLSDAVAYVCWDTAMRKGHQTVVAGLANFTPLLSTAFSLVYLDIAGDNGLWLGCLLVILGTIVAQKAIRPL